MKSKLIAPLFFWIFPATVITLMAGLIYGSVQQSYRQGANDPQIQIAEDSASSLSAGNLPSLVVGSNSVDMASSLATFIIVYDSTGRVIETSAHLNGVAPVPPSGTLDYIRVHGEERFTWEPQKGVRIAAVGASYNSSTNGSGYVLVGRSLLEVEKRVSSLTSMVGIVWILVLIVSYIGVYLVFNFVLRRREV